MPEWYCVPLAWFKGKPFNWRASAYIQDVCSHYPTRRCRRSGTLLTTNLDVTFKTRPFVALVHFKTACVQYVIQAAAPRVRNIFQNASNRFHEMNITWYHTILAKWLTEDRDKQIMIYILLTKRLSLHWNSPFLMGTVLTGYIWCNNLRIRPFRCRLSTAHCTHITPCDIIVVRNILEMAFGLLVEKANI